MHTQGSFLIAAEGKRAVHKIPSSPAASTRESGKGGRLGGETLPFAAGCLNSHNADEAAFCIRSYCFRSICSRAQHGNLGGAAIFTKPAIQTGRYGRNPNCTFAALSPKSKDAGQTGNSKRSRDWPLTSAAIADQRRVRR